MGRSDVQTRVVATVYGGNFAPFQYVLCSYRFRYLGVPKWGKISYTHCNIHNLSWKPLDICIYIYMVERISAW